MGASGGARHVRAGQSALLCLRTIARRLFLAEATADDPRPHFKRVLEKSGNRTIRIIFDPPVDESVASRRILDGIVALGCSYEGANPAYIAINIPPEPESSGSTPIPLGMTSIRRGEKAI